LKTVAECVSLRSIRGLKSFEILWTPDPDYLNRADPDYFNRADPVPFEEKNEVRILQMVEKLRELVTSKAE
jgi:hypothetical protein